MLTPCGPYRRNPVRRIARRIMKAALRWRFRNYRPDSQPAHWVKVAGIKLRVLPDVFDPSLHFTSAHLTRYLLSPGAVPRGSSVLDMGTGAGIAALAAAVAGAASVVAIDINPAAIRCARLNAERYSLSPPVEIRLGHLFEPLARNEVFDLIVCNPPYFRGVPTTAAEMAFLAGDDLQWLRQFAAGAECHLGANGSILVVLGDAADIGAILTIFRRSGWRIDTVARKELIVETLYIFRLRSGSKPARA